MSSESAGVCGIIMPISAIEDKYSEAHWARVKLVLENAISDAGMVPQPVWENHANDVIQAKILQNLYENELVICDISGRNSNVMLELGMRLSTRKPTILVADADTPLPFDTSVIAHSFYQKDLEYNSTKKFVAELTDKIRSIRREVADKRYVSFVENFRFETVTPSTVSVAAEEFLAGKVEEIQNSLKRLERLVRPDVVLETKNAVEPFRVSEDTLDALRRHIDKELTSPETFDVDDRVFHVKFGHGSVTAAEGNKIDVNFDNVGYKRVMSAFLRPSDTPP